VGGCLEADDSGGGGAGGMDAGDLEAMDDACGKEWDGDDIAGEECEADGSSGADQDSSGGVC